VERNLKPSKRARKGTKILDGGKFADEWRAHYIPAMNLVRKGEIPWMNLDLLHRRLLDLLIDEFGLPNLEEETRKRMVRFWHHLPPWRDVREGLVRLRSRYTLGAFSNGGFALLTTLAKEGELPFDCIISAELFRHYKPDEEAYLGACQLLDSKPNETLMVATHKWDLEGAKSSGLKTCFVERPLEKGPNSRDNALSDVSGFADLRVHNFVDLAETLGC
jgi:2-haloacid dehalogenase